MEYIKGKGVYVGQFNEQDLKDQIDKKLVEEMKSKTGLQYINTKIVKSKGKDVGIKIWVCTLNDWSLEF